MLSWPRVFRVVASWELRTFRMPMSKPHVLGNPPVWLHNGTYRELPFALVLPTSRTHNSPPSPTSRAVSAPFPNSRSTSHSSPPLLPPPQQHSRCVPRSGTAPRNARDLPRVPRTHTHAWRVLRPLLPPHAALDARPRSARLSLRSTRCFSQRPHPHSRAPCWTWTQPMRCLLWSPTKSFAARAHIIHFALQNFVGVAPGAGVMFRRPFCISTLLTLARPYGAAGDAARREHAVSWLAPTSASRWR